MRDRYRLTKSVWRLGTMPGFERRFPAGTVVKLAYEGSEQRPWVVREATGRRLVIAFADEDQLAKWTDSHAAAER